MPGSDFDISIRFAIACGMACVALALWLLYEIWR